MERFRTRAMAEEEAITGLSRDTRLTAMINLNVFNVRDSDGQACSILSRSDQLEGIVGPTHHATPERLTGFEPSSHLTSKHSAVIKIRLRDDQDALTDLQSRILNP
jgi:hypothetical protein